jgi:hypothetical protein
MRPLVSVLCAVVRMAVGVAEIVPRWGRHGRLKRKQPSGKINGRASGGHGARGNCAATRWSACGALPTVFRTGTTEKESH